MKTVLRPAMTVMSHFGNSEIVFPFSYRGCNFYQKQLLLCRQRFGIRVAIGPRSTWITDADQKHIFNASAYYK